MNGDRSELVLFVAVGDDVFLDVLRSRDPRDEGVLEVSGGDLSPDDVSALAAALGTGDYRYSRVIVVAATIQDVPPSLVSHLRANYRPLVEQGRVAICAMPFRECDPRPLDLG